MKPLQILEEFLDMMNEQAKILTDDILAPHVDSGKVLMSLEGVFDMLMLRYFHFFIDYEHGPKHHQLRPRHHLQLGHGKARGRATRHRV